jgi:hypothetical protein
LCWLVVCAKIVCVILLSRFAPAFMWNQHNMENMSVCVCVKVCDFILMISINNLINSYACVFETCN